MRKFARNILRSVGPTLVLALILVIAGAATAQAAPKNVAPAAKISASSEYSNLYLGKFVADGVVPPENSQAQDRGHAWCVKGDENRDTGWLQFDWESAVDVAELVYFARTAWYMNEGFKDYEIYIGDEEKPIATGTFKQIHGPQRVKLPAVQSGVRKLRLVFTSSYKGMNPGASEVAVFAEPPTEKELARMGLGAPSFSEPVSLPSYLHNLKIDQPDPAVLAALIERLKTMHGAKYAKADEHLKELASIEKQLETLDAQNADEEKYEAVEAALAKLQLDVLLWDIDKLLVIRRHEIRASHVYTYHYEGQQNGGGLYVIDPRDPSNEPLELIATPDGQILDSDISYDGKKVVFSMRRGDRPGYHVYCINIDGTELVQLTDGPWHDYNACWLPDGGIAFLSSREPQFAYCWHAPVGILHRMEADGSNVVKLSANYLNDFTPYVLNDGRIIYSRWEYVDRPAIPIQSLWTVCPDGCGLTGYFGNRVLTPGTFMDARSIPGTKDIICTMTGHNGPTRGAIGVVDHRKGPNAQEAIVNITPDTPIANVDQGSGNTGGTKPYSCPWPMDKERFLVSARGPLLVRTIDGTCKSTALGTPSNGMQYFFAQPVGPRERPPVIPPRFRDPSLGDTAVVFMQDVYNGLEPQVKRGEVKRIRVVQELSKPIRIDPNRRAFGFQFPVISCGATYAGKDVLGEIPVNDDGSACFKVPSGIPIYFMALDAEGRAVQRMRSFTHLMPGETQGCIGCHENRLDASRPQLGPEFFRQSPRELEPPEWGRGGFDYVRVVQPVLDRHCVKCHNAVDHPKRIDLTGGRTDYFNVSYDVLARSAQGQRGTYYVNWIPTYNGQEWNILEVAPKTWGSPVSLLSRVILSGHPDADGKMRVTLDDVERRRIFAWIDLNVPYYGTSETAYPAAQGCRRLYPSQLDTVLADVGKRRCAECHTDGKIPRREWTRITEPELNPLLVAPLSKQAGGGEWCGRAVFKDKNDPDYQKILSVFQPIGEMIQQIPRMDMQGAKPDGTVSRICE